MALTILTAAPSCGRTTFGPDRVELSVALVMTHRHWVEEAIEQDPQLRAELERDPFDPSAPASCGGGSWGRWELRSAYGVGNDIPKLEVWHGDTASAIRTDWHGKVAGFYVGDVVGLVLDQDGDSLEIYKNGDLIGVSDGDTRVQEHAFQPLVNVYQHSSDNFSKVAHDEDMVYVWNFQQEMQWEVSSPSNEGESIQVNFPDAGPRKPRRSSFLSYRKLEEDMERNGSASINSLRVPAGPADAAPAGSAVPRLSITPSKLEQYVAVPALLPGAPQCLLGHAMLPGAPQCFLGHAMLPGAPHSRFARPCIDFAPDSLRDARRACVSETTPRPNARPRPHGPEQYVAVPVPQRAAPAPTHAAGRTVVASAAAAGRDARDAPAEPKVAEPKAAEPRAFFVCPGVRSNRRQGCGGQTPGSRHPLSSARPPRPPTPAPALLVWARAKLRIFVAGHVSRPGQQRRRLACAALDGVDAHRSVGFVVFLCCPLPGE
jgi:hypothetical protein